MNEEEEPFEVDLNDPIFSKNLDPEKLLQQSTLTISPATFATLTTTEATSIKYYAASNTFDYAKDVVTYEFFRNAFRKALIAIGLVCGYDEYQMQVVVDEILSGNLIDVDQALELVQEFVE